MHAYIAFIVSVTLSSLAAAVQVNPLPAPTSITWGTSGPRKVSNLVLNGNQNNAIRDAVSINISYLLISQKQNQSQTYSNLIILFGFY